MNPIMQLPNRFNDIRRRAAMLHSFALTPKATRVNIYKSTGKGGFMPGAREVTVSVTVNGTSHSAVVPARTLLVHFLRDRLRLTGTHVGCDTTQCGACTVAMDGIAVKSCTVLAAQAS